MLREVSEVICGKFLGMNKQFVVLHLGQFG